MLGVVWVRIPRDQIAPVVLERAIDRDRCGVGAAVLTACQLLRCVLRLVERQHILAVAVLEVVGERKALGPVCAMAVAGLEHPCAIGLVASVHQGNAARE